MAGTAGIPVNRAAAARRPTLPRSAALWLLEGLLAMLMFAASATSLQFRALLLPGTPRRRHRGLLDERPILVHRPGWQPWTVVRPWPASVQDLLCRVEISCMDAHLLATTCD